MYMYVYVYIYKNSVKRAIWKMTYTWAKLISLTLLSIHVYVCVYDREDNENF